MKKTIVSMMTLSYIALASTINGEFVKVFEKWDLPKNEELTISKLGVTFNITPFWFAGVNMYGATSGKRGGFFTFGFESGIQSNPKNLLQVRSGIFVGAGGGGSAPQGGGLMIREFVEGRVNTNYASIGAGISHVDFPNGDIKSTQGYAALYIPFTLEEDNSSTI